MRLTKHHGLGNDFLVTFDPVELTADLARALCDRRRGIGADGLIAARPGEGDVDVRMELRNSDGTVAAMSGNGIRCLAQAILDQRGVAAAELLIGTAAGVRHVTIELSGGRGEAWARADMGAVGPGPLTLGPLSACLDHGRALPGTRWRRKRPVPCTTALTWSTRSPGTVRSRARLPRACANPSAS